MNPNFTPDVLLVNGQLRSPTETHLVSVSSPSFQYGLNVFEGIRVYPSQSNDNLSAFLSDQHISRLLSSAFQLRLSSPPGHATVAEDISLACTSLERGFTYYIKYMLCYLSDGSWATTASPDRVLLGYKSPSIINNINKDYILKSSSIVRITPDSMPPSIKIGSNYINSRLALHDVNPPGSMNPTLPIIYDRDGFVTESSGSCIFCIKGSKIFTPPLSSGILKSITREFMLNNVLADLPFEVFIQKLDRWDICTSDQLFLVGTNVELAFIHCVDDYTLPGSPHAGLIRNTFINSLRSHL